MYKEALRPAWVEVDLGKLDRNIKNIMAKANETASDDNPREIVGVIKADAYGHGAVKCAEVLRKNGVKTFAIATLQEAIELREAGATEDIIMLGLTPDMYAETIVNYDIIPVVCDSENAAAISKAAEAAGKTVHGLIAIDTGMGRIGYVAADQSMAESATSNNSANTSKTSADDEGRFILSGDNITYTNETAIEDIRKIDALTNFKIKGIFSHMATADAFDKGFAKVQEARYNAFYKDLTDAGIDIPMCTLANSASIMEIPSIHFDMVRPGIILYGCYPSNEVDRSLLDIEQVMSVKANIVLLKDVPVGFSCGYGRRFIANRPSKIATLTLGYADGYPRPYSSQAKVIVNGVVCPIAGNICMDQCMVDVTDVPDVKVGDEVIIMGSDGVNSITAEDIADATGTISYEICCAFGQRLPKVYVD